MPTSSAETRELEAALQKAPHVALAVLGDIETGQPNAPVTPQGTAYAIHKLLVALVGEALAPHGSGCFCEDCLVAIGTPVLDSALARTPATATAEGGCERCGNGPVDCLCDGALDP